MKQKNTTKVLRVKMAQSGFMSNEIAQFTALSNPEIDKDSIMFNKMLGNRKAWISSMMQRGFAIDQIVTILVKYYARDNSSALHFLRAECPVIKDYIK